MTDIALESNWELLPDERGKTWKTDHVIVSEAPNGETTTVPLGYEHDRATFAPDCDDNDVFAVHDFEYDIDGAGRKWDSGAPMKRKDVDEHMLSNMYKSWDPKCNARAKLYYNFVRAFAGPSWYWGSLKLWWRSR